MAVSLVPRVPYIFPVENGQFVSGSTSDIMKTIENVGYYKTIELKLLKHISKYVSQLRVYLRGGSAGKYVNRHLTRTRLGSSKTCLPAPPPP